MSDTTIFTLLVIWYATSFLASLWMNSKMPREQRILNNFMNTVTMSLALWGIHTLYIH
jgi:hypothetical protein